jgi:hypothetical protein
MDAAKKNTVYDRLLGIRMKIDLSQISGPAYINEKIWECHSYIEETERFSIEISKEMSAVQQALNNAQSSYETQKETLLVQNEEIKSLPNIRDREARANQCLKKELDAIRNYQNELNDLNNLLKATNLKIKNLNRVNADIKIQLRVIEAQLKLAPGAGMDSAAKSLLEELNKSVIGKDTFEGVVTREEENMIADPSAPLDVNNLLKESIPENLVEPSTPTGIETEEEEEEEVEEEPWQVQEEESSLPEPNLVDLDQVIETKPVVVQNPNSKEGGTKTQIEPKTDIEVDNQKGSHQIGINIDDLLDSFTPKK